MKYLCNQRLYRTKSCRYKKKEADLQCNSHSPLFDFLTLNLLLVPFFAIVLWFSGSSGSRGSGGSGGSSGSLVHMVLVHGSCCSLVFFWFSWFFWLSRF